MRAPPRLFAAAVVALALTTPALTTPARADLTAPEVWRGWQSSGQQISAQGETLTNGTLTLVNVTLAIPLNTAILTATIPRIDLSEQGDGTVAITLSPESDLRLRVQGASGETLNTGFGVALPGLRLIASGDAARQNYAIDAPQITATLTETRLDGEPVDLQFTATLRDLMGQSNLTTGPQSGFASTLTANILELNAKGRDLGTPGERFALTSTYGNIAADLSGGTDQVSTLSHGGAMTSLSVDRPGYVPFGWTSSTTAGRLSTTLRAGMINQTGRISGMDFTLTGGALPLESFQARVENVDWSLRLPTLPRDTPDDIALRLDVGGMTLDQTLWAKFDPTGALPQEPASLHLDVTGKGRLSPDPLSPTGTGPGVLHTLTLNALRLTMAGVALTGQGAFQFDTSAPGTSPAPDGTLDLTLDGSGALLAKLVQLGLLPADQVMGAQMILGLFTTPTGDDRVGTTLTFTPDGKISANGQRVQ